MACGSSGSSSRGAVTGESTAVVAEPIPVRVESNAPATTDSVAARASQPSSGKGGRPTGGPPRAPAEPRSSGCGGTFVNVTVKAAALEHSTLARVAEELLAPLRPDVGAASLSPAIRAFRVPVRDAAAADRVIPHLRASGRVEAVERDGCGVMINR